MRHGLTPFLSAAQTGGHSIATLLYPFVIRFTDEPFHAILAVLAILGICVCVAGRRPLLPLWFAALFVLDPRKAATEATLPEALLIATALTELVIPGLAGAGISFARGHAAPALASGPGIETLLLPRRVKVVLGLLLFYCILSAIGAPAEDTSPLKALSAADREAMFWVARNTPPDSAFLVFASDRLEAPAWPRDRISEWFPVVAERRSVATVQGYEWKGEVAWNTQVELYRSLQLCAERDVECVEGVLAAGLDDFSHVYVPKSKPHSYRFTDCCAAVRSSFRNSPKYVAIYDGPGATVFARHMPAD
jgi:hypothetical protein